LLGGTELKKDTSFSGQLVLRPSFVILFLPNIKQNFCSLRSNIREDENIKHMHSISLRGLGLFI